MSFTIVEILPFEEWAQNRDKSVPHFEEIDNNEILRTRYFKITIPPVINLPDPAFHSSQSNAVKYSRALGWQMDLLEEQIHRADSFDAKEEEKGAVMVWKQECSKVVPIPSYDSTDAFIRRYETFRHYRDQLLKLQASVKKDMPEGDSPTDTAAVKIWKMESTKVATKLEILKNDLDALMQLKVVYVAE
ncbi:MAG: hypothetical protein Q9219_000739 [cf. Caloplaca sp. 3 TL-2023]